MSTWRQERLDAATASWVVGAARGPLGAQVHRWLDDGDDELSVVSRLSGHDLSADRRAALVDVVTGSRRAWRAGQPAGTLWTSAAAEQASHPAVAAWRANRYAPFTAAADVTAGCGSDALALAERVAQVVACDRHAGRLPLLAANLEHRAEVVRADALRPAVAPSVAVWADPGRRVDGRRVRRLADTVPAVPRLATAHGGAVGLGIALSPAVDLDDPGLPDGELEFVAVDGRLVEATLWRGELRGTGPDPSPASRSATLLPDGLHVRGEPADPVPVGAVADVLLEPAAALVRARLHDRLAAEFGAVRVARRRALFTAPHPAPSSPWFRTWRVEDVVAARPKAVRAALRNLPDAPLEIALHGFDADVGRWLRDLGSPATGPSGRRLHLVRTDRGAMAVLTVPDGPHARPSDGAQWAREP